MLHPEILCFFPGNVVFLPDRLAASTSPRTSPPQWTSSRSVTPRTKGRCSFTRRDARRMKGIGTGRDKQWTPQAVLRTSFGIARMPAKRKRWHPEKASAERARSNKATARTNRASAASAGAAHGYVQKVRDATAEYSGRTMEDRHAVVLDQVCAAWEIVTFLVDETDFYIRSGPTRGTQHILMMAASFFQRQAEEASGMVVLGPEGTCAAEVMIPPAAVESTDAATIASAISTRAAWFLAPS